MADNGWREADRLAALDSYDVMDSAAEAAFDDITRLAAQICGVPMALISLVDERRQWFKSAVGLDASETPREVAFCAHAIQQPGLFTVNDAAADPRFARNPLVTGDPNLRFYCGAPLVTDEGFPLGTLCVLDTQPGQLSTAQQFALNTLARQVVVQLELRRALAEQRKAVELRALLVQELQHRVKNTLTTVQAVVSQSLRNAASLDAARGVIDDRLVTMGRAHDIFSEGSWHVAPLIDVIDAAITGGGVARERYRTEGPEVDLSARVALGMSLVLHELNTNAIKFGALSGPSGHVAIQWKAADGRMRFEWREHGGPPVVPPTRRGFGSRLIGSALASELRGGSQIDYAPGGVVWSLDAAMKDVGPIVI